MDTSAFAILVSVDRAVAARDAEATAKETWLAAIRAYTATHPSPPRRKGWTAYERWQEVMHRAVKAEYDAYVAAEEATKRATAAIFEAARAERTNLG